MVWLCCHAGPSHLRPETAQALSDWVLAADKVRYVDVDLDVFEYGRVLAASWQGKDDLAIIEPDIVIRPDVVKAFHECAYDYCCFPYALTTDVMPALGCTRFTRRFRIAHNDAMRRALNEPGGYGRGHFRSVDVALQRYVFARNGIQPHVHVPAVLHLNPKQALVEGASVEPLLEVPLW